MTKLANSVYAYNETRQTFVATDLKIADTHWTRLKGLLGSTRAMFTAGAGLWIVPCHGVHTIGMMFPIDVLYLDENLVVVHLEQNVKPWRFTPIRLEATTVVELPANTVASTSTCVGDRLEIKATGKQTGAPEARQSSQARGTG